MESRVITGSTTVSHLQPGTNTDQIPDAIIGDLDSISDQARNWFEKGYGVSIIHDPDQYSTDFTKCLKWLRQHACQLVGPPGRIDVVVLGGLGGRVDQGFSQIHHMLMAVRDKELLDGNIYLLSDRSLTFVLGIGRNQVEVGKDVFAEHVGIVPLGRPAVITTKGLEWDVENWKTEFGGQVSTSNHLKSDVVFVETNESVLFTLELGSRYQDEGLNAQEPQAHHPESANKLSLQFSKERASEREDPSSL